jgi:hypothetical protein
MNSENSSIAAKNPITPDLSPGNLTTLKSPPKHQGISYQLIKPAISSHKTLISPSSLGPYTPPNAHIKLSSVLRKEQAIVYLPTHSSIFSTTLLSHIIKIPPEAPRAPI